MNRLVPLLLVGLLVLAACTDSNTDPDRSSTTVGVGSTTVPEDGAPTTSGETGESTATTVVPDGRQITVVVDELRAVALASTASTYTTETGVEVVFDIQPLSEIRGRSGDADVDVFMGPHLWAAEMIASGAVSEVEGLDPAVWADRAATAFGSLEGVVAVPFSADSLVLFRNTDLLSEPVADFLDGCAEPVDHCLVMPGLGAAGGYHFTSFVMADASSPFDEHLANLGASAPAIETMGRLVGEGTMELVSTTEARRLFVDGQAAMFIGGPWDIGPIADSGVPYVVEALPASGGVALSSPVSVQGFYLSASAPEAEAATAFLVNHLTQDAAQRELYLHDPRSPVLDGIADGLPAPAGALGSALEAGFLLPPVDLGIYWEELGTALAEIATGGDPVGAVREAADRIAARNA